MTPSEPSRLRRGAIRSRGSAAMLARLTRWRSRQRRQAAWSRSRVDAVARAVDDDAAVAHDLDQHHVGAAVGIDEAGRPRSRAPRAGVPVRGHAARSVAERAGRRARRPGAADVQDDVVLARPSTSARGRRAAARLAGGERGAARLEVEVVLRLARVGDVPRPVEGADRLRLAAGEEAASQARRRRARGRGCAWRITRTRSRTGRSAGAGRCGSAPGRPSRCPGSGRAGCARSRSAARSRRPASRPARPVVGLTITGVTMMTSSVWPRLKLFERNSAPSTGTVPRPGIFEAFCDEQFCISPAIAKLWPLARSTVVSARRVLSDGTWFAVTTGEVELADLGRDLQADAVAVDHRRREVQPDAEVLELDGVLVVVDHRVGILAAGEEARALARARGQVRLGQDGDQPLLGQRLQHHVDVELPRVEAEAWRCSPPGTAPPPTKPIRAPSSCARARSSGCRAGGRRCARPRRCAPAG